ncbi:LIM domain transcription factor LMO4.1-like [Apis dorsata]|uniref:LIM domain transcription factor LMO4.1-like n=1 Tax=Apis dorsata TaxID=7462 RepID=UPI001293CB64|nr:LIM domain transcription factor LMO4.1-like [Apis dorsata]
MGSNGHHHGAAGMMTDHPHHPGHPHPHLPSHPAYPPVNHNNNCTLKQEGGPSGPTGIQQCAGCGGQIVERWLLLAMDRYWHNGCLKCSYCGAALAEIGHSCYTRSGMILCKSDYRRMFGSSGACAGCGNAIPATELVMRAGGSVFHQKCFTCSKCGNQLVSGDRYYLLSGSPVSTSWTWPSEGIPIRRLRRVISSTTIITTTITTIIRWESYIRDWRYSKRTCRRPPIRTGLHGHRTPAIEQP